MFWIKDEANNFKSYQISPTHKISYPLIQKQPFVTKRMWNRIWSALELCHIALNVYKPAKFVVNQINLKVTIGRLSACLRIWIFQVQIMAYSSKNIKWIRDKGRLAWVRISKIELCPFTFHFHRKSLHLDFSIPASK